MQRNRVRIIGGAWRRRWLRFPAVEGLRPTPDRVRETLFNWLGQDLTGRHCLDLFAGSGALGFEAASRSASRVVMVERDARAFHALQDSARTLAASSVELVRADALEFLAFDAHRYDFIFVDPPYAMRERGELMARIARRLQPEGLVYAEAPEALAQEPGWSVWREARAGAVHYRLLRTDTSDPSRLSGDVRSDHTRS